MYRTVVRMGMPSRKFILLGLAGAAGLAAIADQTLLSKASAGLGELSNAAGEVQKIKAIASSLESGDPNALQGLLDTLASEEGVTPGEAAPDLFGLGAFMPQLSDTAAEEPFEGALASGAEREDTTDARVEPIPSERRVSMVMTSAQGGYALINGTPIRAGQTVDGITLLRVHEDGVTVRENRAEYFLALR